MLLKLKPMLFQNYLNDEILKNKGEKKEEKKEETDNEKIALVAEIARNIIDEGTEKLKQTRITFYTKFIQR